MNKRLLLISLALLLVLGGIAGIKFLQIRAMIEQGKHLVEPPATVSSAQVQSRQWEITVRSVGSLAAVQGVMVASQLAGRVKVIAFESGALAAAGDLLVQLDIFTEQAQLREAEAAAALAGINFDRQARLLAQHSVAQAEYDLAEATYKEAAARADVIRALIDKKMIRAPFAGRLGIRLVNLGQIVNEAEPLVTLQRLDPIFVNFQLPQQQLFQVEKGYPVRLRSAGAAGPPFTGRITTINPEIDRESRNFAVQALVANQAELLRPGMYVEVEVVRPEKQEVLVIPGTAVLYAPYSDSVFVIEAAAGEPQGATAKVLRQQFITLGERRGDLVSVESGLAAGETVVSAGGFKFRHGQAVVVDNQLQPEFKLKPRPANQ